MKKNLIFLMLMLGALASFTASSSDDGGNGQDDKNAGSENTWDVAVTGAVQEKDATSAVITGYVNLNQLTEDYSSYRMGVQIGHEGDYHADRDDWGGKEYASSLVGNKFVLYLRGYASGLKWYFRTFVYVNGHYYYGATKSFYTDELNIINITRTLDATEVTSNSAKISYYADVSKYSDDPTIYSGIACADDQSLLKEKFIRSIDYEYQFELKRHPEKEDFDENGIFTIELSDLPSHTTFYYCAYTVTWIYGDAYYRLSDIKSFTTR